MRLRSFSSSPAPQFSVNQHAIVPAPPASARPASEVARAGLFLAVLCFGIWLISKVGFIWAAPGVAVGLMALMGERRGFWLLMGAGATPAVIWLLVDVLLDRSLP